MNKIETSPYTSGYLKRWFDTPISCDYHPDF